MDCPEKSVREILDAGDFWHLSDTGNPSVWKSLSNYIRASRVYSNTSRLTSSAHIIPGAMSFFLASCGLIPMLRTRELVSPPHRMLTALSHSLFSPKLSGVLQVQTLIKWCRKLYPTPRNTHPDSMHAFPAHGGWASSPYLCHKFPSRLLVLSAPLCFASWIFSFPALQAKHKQRSGCE